MTIIEAMKDRNLFGPWFTGPSWRVWRVMLKALFGLKLASNELALFRKHTGRDEVPSGPAREGWFVMGRRAGKSIIAALIAVWCACFRDYRPHLAPGEVATILILASDRRQARVIFRYVVAFLEGVPMLRKLIAEQTKESIALPSRRVTIEIHANSFRSLRGLTVACCVADEVAFWRSDDSANPDSEVLAAVRPTMATIPNSLLVCLSSPYSQNGELYRAYRDHFGKPGPVLVWKAASLEMNPTLDPAVVAAAYEADPQSAAAEYGAEFRSDLESFVSAEVVDRCTILDRHELPSMRALPYVAFVDPSGGSSDEMTLAIAHSEGERVVLDCVRARRPPFSPDAVTQEFAELLKAYGCNAVTGDRYAGEWPRERFQKYGVTYVPSPSTRSELYVDLLPLLNSGIVELLDLKKIRAQLCALERRTGRSGKDSIDHAPGAHDDVANAVAGALVLAHRNAAHVITGSLVSLEMQSPFNVGGSSFGGWNF